MKAKDPTLADAGCVMASDQWFSSWNFLLLRFRCTHLASFFKFLSHVPGGDGHGPGEGHQEDG